MKKSLRSALDVALVGFIGLALAWLAWGQQTAPPSPSEPASNLLIYRGILQSVDPAARTVAVQGAASVSRVFFLAPDAQIIAKAKPIGELADLVVGSEILVRYQEQGGRNVAHEIGPVNLRSP
ncbi:MAG TPA: hypothetical protein VMV72_09835 [Verrucomicrobiae bacterium]|nr:hypothetical protein [Verrucomicrobiae bacterium]